MRRKGRELANGCCGAILVDGFECELQRARIGDRQNTRRRVCAGNVVSEPRTRKSSFLIEVDLVRTRLDRVIDLTSVITCAKRAQYFLRNPNDLLALASRRIYSELHG
jgi:hypothetical protein